MAAYEMHRPMMRPPEAEFLQDHVRRVGEVAIREEHQVLREADFGDGNGFGGGGGDIGHAWLIPAVASCPWSPGGRHGRGFAHCYQSFGRRNPQSMVCRTKATTSQSMAAHELVQAAG